MRRRLRAETASQAPKAKNGTAQITAAHNHSSVKNKPTHSLVFLAE